MMYHRLFSLAFVFTTVNCFRVLNAEKYCTTAKEDTNCTRLCHCSGNRCTNFSPFNATCQKGCKSGWMGNDCQYRNIAIAGPLNSTTPRHYTVDLMVSYPVSAIRLLIENTFGSSSFVENKIEVSFTNQTRKTTCVEKYLLLRQGIKKVDIYCEIIAVGNRVDVHFGDDINITTIQVFGVKTFRKSFDAVTYPYKSVLVTVPFEYLRDDFSSINSISLDRLCFGKRRNVALWKNTSQSSTSYAGNAMRAVDGSDGSHKYINNSCSHTNETDKDPYWRIDLGQNFTVTWSQIDNRAELLGKRLNGFEMMSSGYSIYKDNTTSEDGPGDKILIHASNSEFPYQLQHLNITKHTEDSILTLCEVQLFACRPTSSYTEDCHSLCPKNCAPDFTCIDSRCPKCKTGWKGEFCDQVNAGAIYCTGSQKRACDMSSSCNACKFLCHCIDDIECNTTTGECSNGCAKGWMGTACQYSNVAYSDSSANKWTDGDDSTCGIHIPEFKLVQEYLIRTIRLILSESAHYDVQPTAANVLIEISSSTTDFNMTCEWKGVKKRTIEIDCPRTGRGDLVRVQWPPANMTICEFQIYGGRNLAVWNRTEQSSTYASRNISFPASLAVDGIATTEFFSLPRTCQQTNIENGVPSWWRVFLPNTSLITRMRIYLSNDQPERSRGMTISLYKDSDLRKTYNVSNSRSFTSIIDFLSGLPEYLDRVVIRSEVQSSFHICEFQAFGCMQEPCNFCPKRCRKSELCNNNNFHCPSCEAGWEGLYCEKEKTCEHLTLTPKLTFTPKRNSQSPFVVNDSITFSCEKGYELVGKGTLVCTDTKTWSSIFPTCKEKNCTIPLTSHLVEVNSTNKPYTYGVTVTFRCESGFDLRGNSTLTCNEEGSWDEDMPLCIETPTSINGTQVQSLVICLASGVPAAVVFICLAVIGICCRNRKKSLKRQKDKYDKSTVEEGRERCKTSTVTLELEPRGDSKGSGDASYCNLISVDPMMDTETRNRVYYDFTVSMKPSEHAVRVQDFIDYVDERKHDKDALGKEFAKLKSGLQYSTEAATKPRNNKKNRYKYMYPYDLTRVVLVAIEGQEDSDYINASYIHGYCDVRHYIAAQGPLGETIDDFWRMIWQENVSKVVMLTNLYEEMKVKCVQYWPEEGEPMSLTQLTVKLIDTENFADFIIRKMTVTMGEKSRIVNQYHFTAWPDKGIPTYASSLIHFRTKVLQAALSNSGPILVHCSAGVGRTGTFVALDYLLQQASDTGYVDVFSCVETLRRQRINMVQTKEQYVFVHLALLEALICPTSATANDFPRHYEAMLEFDNVAKKQKLLIEFETLNRTSSEIPDTGFWHAADQNRKNKNRYSNILPVERERPLLAPSSSEDQYINATYLPGYLEKKPFIITQMPLPNTVTDFWRLVHGQNVSTIVMLNNEHPPYNEALGIYWPAGQSKKETFGQYDVQLINSVADPDDDFDMLNMTYQYKGEDPTAVRLFKAKFWPETSIVPCSMRSLLKLTETAELHRKQQNSGPMIVHCMNGCERSGLYCVIQVVLERLKIEQDVAIQQIIKQMRSRRPQIVPNLDQFKFCHDIVIEFMKQYDIYSNF